MESEVHGCFCGFHIVILFLLLLSLLHIAAQFKLYLLMLLLSGVQRDEISKVRATNSASYPGKPTNTQPE